MSSRRHAGFATLSVMVLGGLAVTWTAAGAPAQSGRGAGSVELSAAPEQVEVVGLPCLPASLRVGMTNTGADDVYADMELEVQPPVVLDRQVFSSWLPAGDPDVTVTARVAVTTPRDTAPGTYRVHLTADRDRLTVPVQVLPLPPKGPGDDLALGEQASASSTHGNFKVCGAVDGDTSSDNWSTSTGWNDGTRGSFPDTYDVTLAEPASISRVELYTLDSQRYPAASYGLRDWDVQVLAGGTWQTVVEVRGNVAGRVTSTFDPVTATAVRIVALDSNSHDYSRIVELEVFSN